VKRARLGALLLTVTILLGCAIGAFYGRGAHATPSDPGVALTQASDNVFQASTFSLSGPITSLVYNESVTWILQGNWTLNVDNGNVTSFNANITALSDDGQRSLSFQLTNFTARTELTQSHRGTLYSFGTMDINSNATNMEQSIPANVNIANMKVITIILTPSGAGSIFSGQPIYGTSNIPQTTTAQTASSPMLPEENGAAQLRNVTPGVGTPGFSNPFIK
jgi:hypothetical protein